MKEKITTLYHILYQAYGPQGWWPGDSPLEVAVGAILTQNTNWKNVATAIARLKQAGLLNAEALFELPQEVLVEHIRPAGYYNIKARRLKSFLAFLFSAYGGSLEEMAAAELEEVRQQLLAVKGIGPETADSILLYALEKPIFVVDAYTFRILSRHNLISDPSSYDQLQSIFLQALPPDTALYKEYHALLVQTGKDCCRPRPHCEACPVQGFHGCP
ncbi:endonuclease III domain-containing protein [Desulfobacca acetoxidans]